MALITTGDARDYLTQLRLANDYEIDELRNAPVDLKLRQLWALMTSTHLWSDDAERDAEASKVRERWARLYQALHD
jgi:hypothetical protein